MIIKEQLDEKNGLMSRSLTGYKQIELEGRSISGVQRICVKTEEVSGPCLARLRRVWQNIVGDVGMR